MERGNSFFRFLDKYLGIPLTAPAAVFRRLDKKFIRSHLDSCQHIGIFCPGAIGDLLLLSALADGIKAKFPACRLEIIASTANASALPLIPGIDAGFAAPISKLAEIIAHIRQRRYDLFFDASQWARAGSLVAAASAAALTVGFKTKGQCRSLPFDIAVVHDKRQHEVGNFLALGRALWPDLDGRPRLNLPVAENLEKGKRIYCHMWAACGKGRELKQWNPDYWALLIEKLLAAGYEVALTGGKNDATASGDFLARHFPLRDSICSLAGRSSLAHLAALFASATAVISVNTGIMHLAALAGAPTVGLHGPTNPNRWGPIGPRTASVLPRKGQMAYLNLGFEYPAHAEYAMLNLPVEDVLGALRSIGVPV